MEFPFNLAALGGTFDHFHVGHQHLLSSALSFANQIMIGIVTDATKVQKLYPTSLQSYTERRQAVESYLENHGFKERYSVIPLNDVYGPTIETNDIDLLVVTALTNQGAEAINTKRNELNLPPLPVKVIDVIKDKTGEVISSTRIRQGLIDRQGNYYAHTYSQIIHITPHQRSFMSQPQGEIIDPFKLTPTYLEKAVKIALVGDQTTEYFITHHLPFHYSLIDYHINRLPHPTNLNDFKPLYSNKTANPPGTIQPTSVTLINELLAYENGLLIIDGEEDLLGFPLIALLPLQSCVYYGQPHQGLVEIIVTESAKQNFQKMIAGD